LTTTRNEAIAKAFHDACLAELQALKPGNVHRFSEDPRMSVADFDRSAAEAAPFIGEAGLSVGVRIRRAIEATIAAVGQNTNLGIILLSAPLAEAALDRSGGALRSRLARVLGQLSVEDAREAYVAIRLARPGGLGLAPRHDVASEPEVTLLEAMRAAEPRDRIAWNYVHDFADIFERGIPRLKQGLSRFGDKDWAATIVYLGFLADTPDSLIARKFGGYMAAQVLEEARKIVLLAEDASRPESVEAELMAFDRWLKERGLNPGTSADLTVATLFASALETMDKSN
jgi:triphosphoribosyl-dephospho-CoA synthase